MLTAFQTQQWLPERALILGYNKTACLVISKSAQLKTGSSKHVLTTLSVVEFV
jgi:hypothetical protein